MPYSGRDPRDRRCSARSKRTGERCKAVSFPFTDPPLCKAHGAYTPAVIEKARKAAARFEMGWHPTWEGRPSALERRIRLERFYEAEARYQRHLFKKTCQRYGWDIDELDRQRDQLARERASEQERRFAKAEGKPERTVWVGEPIEFEIEPW